MILMEALSCVPEHVKFTMSVEQLISKDSDFDVSMLQESGDWVILKGESKLIYAISE
ncbi:hypothetical protein D3C81_95220 [compost metagenome]